LLVRRPQVRDARPVERADIATSERQNAAETPAQKGERFFFCYPVAFSNRLPFFYGLHVLIDLTLRHMPALS